MKTLALSMVVLLTTQFASAMSAPTWDDTVLALQSNMPTLDQIKEKLSNSKQYLDSQIKDRAPAELLSMGAGTIVSLIALKNYPRTTLTTATLGGIWLFKDAVTAASVAAALIPAAYLAIQNRNLRRQLEETEQTGFAHSLNSIAEVMAEKVIARLPQPALPANGQ